MNAENFGGFSDWRMPTQEELRSIVYYQKYNPAIDIGYFPNTVSQYYWSSSTFKDSGDNQIDGIETKNGTGVTLHMGLNTGRYFIKITPLGEAETIASYTLTIQNSDQTDLEIESNNTLKFANAIEKNISRRGRIYSASYSDYFGFHVPETTAFSIEFNPETTSGDYTIKIVDDNNGIITQQTSADGTAKTFPASTYSGNYYIKIEPGADIDQYSPYKLNITSDGTLTGLKQTVGITVSGTDNAMTTGQTQTLTAAAAYSDASSNPITSPVWTSLDETIATVNASGLVTAAAPGTTSIIAALGELTGKFDITVGVPPNYYEQRHGNLILVAGGGTDSTDPLFESTQYLSDLVYRRFQHRFFQDKDIFYFNPITFHDLDGDGYDNNIVDEASPTVTKFGKSITDWAAGQSTDGPLYIYMIDHGGINRVIITSANDNDAYIELGGSASFTQFFIDRLLTGDSVLNGWERAKTQLSDMGIPYSTMQPQLMGTTLAPSIILGGKFAIAPIFPEITARSANASIQADTPQTLFAEVSDENGIEDVWAVVITPDYTSPATSSDLEAPQVNQPVISLKDMDKDGRYEAVYENFIYNGEYKFKFYAKSKNGNLGLSPSTVLTVTGGQDIAIIPGDINNDKNINLADAVLALKICADADTSGQTINLDAKIGTGGQIGLEEVIFILRKTAGM